MARSWTVARLVGPEDWAGVHRLWTEALADATPTGDATGRQVGAERLEQVLSRPGVTTLVAEHDDDLVGLMVATSDPLSALTDSACVTVEILYVTPARRGRGVGHLLLAKAALLAEQTGATHVVCNVPSQSRDLNRFFARMGFASTVTRRITSPAALRRRLSGEEGRPFDKVLARRRSLRARTGLTQPLEIVQPRASAS
ncbi:GNAT family N-acetyltransferase [Arsenicicoccus bolidensis]|uniref:GNAT family N-acetyltransferase n=2 Tax=Intrasporangiaceae TaxID=85021 RepID=A0ABS9Q1E6_9MICO|nr:GNAT family N-acetyltransferase [Arsenicicoccus bolidensis]MCG7321679.1 GNAT family N-acetyltransferase [Arsenicicoccus bolidensis]